MIRGYKESIKMHECNETRCYGWQDNRKMQKMWKKCMQENLDGSRGVEPGVDDLAVDRYRCRANVDVQKYQIQEMRLNRSTKCRKAIEGKRTFLIDPPGVEEVSRLR